MYLQNDQRLIDAREALRACAFNGHCFPEVTIESIIRDIHNIIDQYGEPVRGIRGYVCPTQTCNVGRRMCQAQEAMVRHSQRIQRITES